MNVVIAVYRDGLGTVFGSLYATPAEYLRQAGVEVSIVNFAPLGEFLRPEQVAQWRARRWELKRVWSGELHRWPVFPSRAEAILDDSISIAAYINRFGLNRPGSIMHCGGAVASYQVLQARERLRTSYPKIVMHSWGPLADEYAYGLTGCENSVLSACQADKHAILRSREIFAYRNADAVIGIAEPMLDYARSVLGADARKLFKIPCLVDHKLFSSQVANRAALRRRIGLENRFIVTFSGALHRWQKPEALFEIFNLIRAEIPQAFFLILTLNFEKAEALARKFMLSPRQYRVESIKYPDVPSYLAASDIGLLARGMFEAKSRVNLFSSPIKVPEYLAAGCPVVMADGIGDLSDVVQRHGVGVVAGELQDVSDLAVRLCSFLQEYRCDEAIIRERCTALAKAHFDVRTRIGAYREVYLSLEG